MKQNITAQLSQCKYCGHKFIPGIEGTVDGTICYEHEYLLEEPKVQEWNGIGWRPEVEMSDETEADS